MCIATTHSIDDMLHIGYEHKPARTGLLYLRWHTATKDVQISIARVLELIHFNPGQIEEEVILYYNYIYYVGVVFIKWIKEACLYIYNT